ncbi:MAG: PLP-dependent aminotransferase family protein [Actinobacteria bacterium]|nr:PLP-dependent aminotransferase family protein [Actinomycetota bacterium]
MARSNLIQSERTKLPRLLGADLHGVVRGQQAASLMSQLRRAVHAGSLREGTLLPATRALAGDLGVSRGVVVRAYEQLVAEGYLTSHQGRGTQVARVHHPEPAATPLAAVYRPTNPGLPPGGMFPRAAWLRSTTRALTGLPDADLGYGDPAGLPRLRQELSSYLGRVRALVAPPDRILVVNGFAQASRLLADVLTVRGVREIGLEDPGSVGLREQLTQAGLTCVPVPVDEEGIRVEDLVGSGLRVVVVTPAHQFPTGVVTSPARRHALVRWARETDGLVVEDDYDAEFRYDRTPVGALQGLDPDVVAYGGSISKTLAPGLRIGWLVLPAHHVAAFTDAKYATDLGTGVLEQATLADFLACGAMDHHIRAMTTRYRTRRDHLVQALATHLPDWTVTGTSAGLHLMVHPGRKYDEAALAALAQRCGLDARPLSQYAIRSPDRPGLVIGYGHQHTGHLAEAVATLARTRGGRGTGSGTTASRITPS